ncbi:MAG: rod shape-determining protein MreD [Geminicoccaceae bacterium]
MSGLSVAEAALRQVLPFLSALIAVLVDRLPVAETDGGTLFPWLTIAVLFFWSIYAADLIPVWATFLIGLLNDALAGLPLGFTALALVLGRELVIARHRYFHAKPFLVIWASFAVLVSAIEFLRAVTAMLWFGHLIDPMPVVFAAGLTVAAYPFVAWLLSYLHSAIAAGSDAEP